MRHRLPHPVTERGAIGDSVTRGVPIALTLRRLPYIMDLPHVSVTTASAVIGVLQAHQAVGHSVHACVAWYLYTGI
jgi:hypothetical protein